jgi:hypothetical protein
MSNTASAPEVKAILEEFESKDKEAAAEAASKPAAPKNPFEGMSPEEQAAATFKMALPEFNRLVDKLSMKQLVRCIKAINEAPLNNEKFRFMVQLEADVFQLGMAMKNAQFVMFQAAIAQQLLEEKKKEVAVSEETSNTEKKEGESNESTEETN